MAIRSPVLCAFLIASSHIKPVPNSRAPAIKKSNRVQLTSSVNCIAINGMSNRIADMITMLISLLFCIIINVLISPTLLATIAQTRYVYTTYSKLINFQLYEHFYRGFLHYFLQKALISISK